jgi:hypothetical protein
MMIHRVYHKLCNMACRPSESMLFHQFIMVPNTMNCKVTAWLWCGLGQLIYVYTNVHTDLLR